MAPKKDLTSQLESIEQTQRRLAIKQELLVSKALASDNPNDIMKAQDTINKLVGTGEKKSYLVDPNEFLSTFGFKDKPTSLSYDMLRAMAKTSVINAIIRTRQNQDASFAQPATDRYSVGYEIRKKSYLPSTEPAKLSTQEQKEIEQIIEFLEEGIVHKDKSIWSDHDDFDTFMRKTSKDSLIYDQMTFEIVRTRNGKLHEFFATDGATYRIADSYIDDEYQQHKKEKIAGHYPSYVQVFQNKIMEEYYSWELCFGVRNVLTDVRMNGYGVSELEDLVNTITAILWGEDYNRRFFKQGSAPKGILKVSGNVTEAKLREFKQQWNAQMRGVQNAFKTPILEADKMDWVDLQRTNRDMEYSNWLEFLIKVSSAIFLIDPAEVNFPFNGSPNEQFLFKGDNSDRLKFSRDKGLAPLMKFKAKKINKYLVAPFCTANLGIEPKYILSFKGINTTSVEAELDMDVKCVINFDTLNEVRARRGSKPIDGGDIVLNPIYFQSQMTQQQGQEGMEPGSAGEGEGENEEGKPANPFEKAITDYFKTL